MMYCMSDIKRDEITAFYRIPQLVCVLVCTQLNETERESVKMSFTLHRDIYCFYNPRLSKSLYLLLKCYFKVHVVIAVSSLMF